jgi:plastocyanin
MLRFGGVLAALTALAVVGVGGSASAADTAKGPSLNPQVKIKGNGNPHFVAPEVVGIGQELEIVNRTDPTVIGPHTFSLVEKEALPKTNEEIEKCSNLKLVCKDIANAHKVDPQTFAVEKPDVEKGFPGWDATFDGAQQKGDSWYTETQDETTSRQVSAGPGNLWFVCAVHPFMQGKVKVLEI